jgi:hypothetical protein
MCFDLGIVLVLGYAGDKGMETSEALGLAHVRASRGSDEGRVGRRTN